MTLCDEIITQLRAMSSPDNVAGMARFGINAENTLGVSMPALRSMAKAYRKSDRVRIFRNIIYECLPPIVPYLWGLPFEDKVNEPARGKGTIIIHHLFHCEIALGK